MSADRWALRKSTEGGYTSWVVFPPDDIAGSDADPLEDLYLEGHRLDHTTGTERHGYGFTYSPTGYSAALRALGYVYQGDR